MRGILLKLKELKTRELIIALVIVLLPFLDSLWRLFPNEKLWETRLFVFNPDGFTSVKAFFWLIFTRLVLIIALFIWYKTCRHWWRNAVLVPLTIEVFKTTNIINNISIENYNIDEIEFISSLPIILPIVLLLTYFSNKINYYSSFLKLRAELNHEIESLFCERDLYYNNNVNKIYVLYEELKNNKNNLTQDVYLKILLQLRKELYNLK